MGSEPALGIGQDQGLRMRALHHLGASQHRAHARRGRALLVRLLLGRAPAGARQCSARSFGDCADGVTRERTARSQAALPLPARSHQRAADRAVIVQLGLAFEAHLEPSDRLV